MQTPYLIVLYIHSTFPLNNPILLVMLLVIGILCLSYLQLNMANEVLELIVLNIHGVSAIMSLIVQVYPQFTFLIPSPVMVMFQVTEIACSSYLPQNMVVEAVRIHNWGHRMYGVSPIVSLIVMYIHSPLP